MTNYLPNREEIHSFISHFSILFATKHNQSINHSPFHSLPMSKYSPSLSSPLSFSLLPSLAPSPSLSLFLSRFSLYPLQTNRCRYKKPNERLTNPIETGKQTTNLDMYICICIYVPTLLRYIDRYIDLIDRFCAVQCSAVEREGGIGCKVCQDQSWLGVK